MEGVSYETIVQRRSVRRYERTPLEAEVLQRVRDLVAAIQPLVAENVWRVRYADELAREDLSALLGAYGGILTPPHALVPYLVGERQPLVDLGYRAEQLAVGLQALGLASCFVGTLTREAPLLARLQLPAGAQIGALLVYGRESRSRLGQGVNRAMRAFAGATNKLPLQQLCYLESFERPGSPPEGMLPLLEAGRRAPSAVNAQPWRFLWREDVLHLFVQRHNARYGAGAGQAYRYYDGGLCMANVMLALEARGMAGVWRLYGHDGVDAPPHPQALEPLAALELRTGA